VAERTAEQIKEYQLFTESRRLIENEVKGMDSLLDAALDGRAQTPENVVKLWRLVARAFQATLSLPEGRCRSGGTVYWNEVAAFLRNSGWSDEQLAALRSGQQEGPDAFDDWQE
jgi:hypothetical protein